MGPEAGPPGVPSKTGFANRGVATAARRELNGVAFGGCGPVAGPAGVAARSWWAFLVALAVAAGWALYNGDIRPDQVRR